MYAAIDTETSGLYSRDGDVLLQFAMFVVDKKYEVLDDKGFECVFTFTPKQAEMVRARAIPYVQNMHDKTGLWDRLSTPSAVSYAEGDALAVEYLSKFSDQQLRILGNSITLDRNFLEGVMP